VIRLSPEAEAQVDQLVFHFEALLRSRAIENLVSAIEQAHNAIETAPLAGLPAPRPYPELRRAGRLWLKRGAYWIAYRVSEPPVITGVFHESGDIPRRV